MCACVHDRHTVLFSAMVWLGVRGSKDALVLAPSFLAHRLDSTRLRRLLQSHHVSLHGCLNMTACSNHSRFLCTYTLYSILVSGAEGQCM